jgi:hypothetical protein
MLYLREKSRTTDYAAYTGGVFFLERGGDSIRLSASAVTPGFFSVLGARPLLGRVFREDENLHVLGHPLIVLSHAFWQSRLGGRPEVVGEQIRLNGRAFSVVGVMPADFREHWWERRGLSGSDAWIPAMMAPAGMHPSAKAWRDTPLAIEASGSSIWLSVGRVRPGHSLAEARAEADLLGHEVAALWPTRTRMFASPLSSSR